MKKSLPYDIRVLNGLDGDPAVYVSMPQSGEALLFDLGDLSQLTHKELLKVKDVFISHTHMDHFQDFDRLLRAHIPHRRRLRLHGPKGLAEQVSFKIRSYTWNLIEDDQLHFIVQEWWPKEGTLRRFEVSKKEGFLPKLISETSWDGKALLSKLGDASVVHGIALDHCGIDSISYQLCSPVRSKIRSELLDDKDRKPGPWLKQLQEAYAEDQLDRVINVHGKDYPAGELAAELLEAIPSQSLVYLTDAGFDTHNLGILIKNFKPSYQLLSECSFADRDRDRAKDKAHLSSKHAALIAAALEAENLQLFHVSNIYAGESEEVVAEAQDFFQSFKGLSPESFQDELKAEMLRMEAD